MLAGSVYGKTVPGKCIYFALRKKYSDLFLICVHSTLASWEGT
jgi:hypothetical protein